MLKKFELTNPQSCLNRADIDEMVFTLLARDAVAPWVIRFWCFLRVVIGKNEWGDPQIVEALQCARVMIKQRKERKKNA